MNRIRIKTFKKRVLALFLSFLMVSGLMPGWVDSDLPQNGGVLAAEDTGNAMEEYITLPMEIYDFHADNLLFQYDQGAYNQLSLVLGPGNYGWPQLDLSEYGATLVKGENNADAMAGLVERELGANGTPVYTSGAIRYVAEQVQKILNEHPEDFAAPGTTLYDEISGKIRGGSNIMTNSDFEQELSNGWTAEGSSNVVVNGGFKKTAEKELQLYGNTGAVLTQWVTGLDTGVKYKLGNNYWNNTGSSIATVQVYNKNNRLIASYRCEQNGGWITGSTEFTVDTSSVKICIVNTSVRDSAKIADFALLKTENWSDSMENNVSNSLLQNTAFRIGTDGSVGQGNDGFFGWDMEFPTQERTENKADFWEDSGNGRLGMSNADGSKLVRWVELPAGTYTLSCDFSWANESAIVTVKDGNWKELACLQRVADPSAEITQNTTTFTVDSDSWVELAIKNTSEWTQIDNLKITGNDGSVKCEYNFDNDIWNGWETEYATNGFTLTHDEGHELKITGSSDKYMSMLLTGLEENTEYSMGFVYTGRCEEGGNRIIQVVDASTGKQLGYMDVDTARAYGKEWIDWGRFTTGSGCTEVELRIMHNGGATGELYMSNLCVWGGTKGNLLNEMFNNNTSGVVTLYQDLDYGGYAVNLSEGCYTTEALNAAGVKDNDVTSLKVKSGYAAMLYDNGDFTGDRKAVASDISWIGNEWNDRASSVIVSKTARNKAVSCTLGSFVSGFARQATGIEGSNEYNLLAFGNNGAVLKQQVSGLADGNTYFLAYWANGEATITVKDHTGAVIATEEVNASWTQHRFEFTPSGGWVTVEIRNKGNGDTQFNDMRVYRKVDSSNVNELGNYEETKAKAENGTLTYESIQTCYDYAYLLMNNFFSDLGNTLTMQVPNYNKLQLKLVRDANGNVVLDEYGNPSYAFYANYDMEFTGGSDAIQNREIIYDAATKTISNSDRYINGYYQFGFFPVDGLGYNDSLKGEQIFFKNDLIGNAASYADLTQAEGITVADDGKTRTEEHNYHYSISSHGQFVYHEDDHLFFDFTGDDDTYLFINGKLALDIGGAHRAYTGRIELNEYADELGLAEGGVYSFDFFYMERHTDYSNLRVNTNIKLIAADASLYKNAYNDADKGIADGVGSVFENDWITYEFKLLASPDAPLYDLAFVDSILNVDISQDSLDDNTKTQLSNLTVTVRKPRKADGTIENTTEVWEKDSGLTEEKLKELLANGIGPNGELTIKGYRLQAKSDICNEKSGSSAVYDTIHNTVYAVMKAPTTDGGETVLERDADQTVLVKKGDLSVEKNAYNSEGRMLEDGTSVTKGENITYEFVISNSGTAPLKNLVVKDDKLGIELTKDGIRIGNRTYGDNEVLSDIGLSAMITKIDGTALTGELATQYPDSVKYIYVPANAFLTAKLATGFSTSDGSVRFGIENGRSYAIAYSSSQSDYADGNAQNALNSLDGTFIDETTELHFTGYTPRADAGLVAKINRDNLGGRNFEVKKYLPSGTYSLNLFDSTKDAYNGNNEADWWNEFKAANGGRIQLAVETFKAGNGTNLFWLYPNAVQTALNDASSVYSFSDIYMTSRERLTVSGLKAILANGLPAGSKMTVKGFEAVIQDVESVTEEVPYTQNGETYYYSRTADEYHNVVQVSATAQIEDGQGGTTEKELEPVEDEHHLHVPQPEVYYVQEGSTLTMDGLTDDLFFEKAFGQLNLGEGKDDDKLAVHVYDKNGNSVDDDVAYDSSTGKLTYQVPDEVTDDVNYEKFGDSGAYKYEFYYEVNGRVGGETYTSGKVPVTVYAYDISDVTYVLDYGLPVELNTGDKYGIFSESQLHITKNGTNQERAELLGVEAAAKSDSMIRDGIVLTANDTAVSAQMNGMYLKQDQGLELKGNHKYTLSFDVTASADKVIQAELQSNMQKYKYLSDPINLKAGQKQTVTYECTINGAQGGAGSSFALLFGRKEGEDASFTLTISNLTLTDGYSTQNLLTNANFAKGMDAWQSQNNSGSGTVNVQTPAGNYQDAVAWSADSGLNGGLTVGNRGWFTNADINAAENRSKMSVNYTPEEFMDSIDKFVYGVRVTDNNGLDLSTLNQHNSVAMEARVNILPASVVYYEDNFGTIGYKNHATSEGTAQTGIQSNNQDGQYGNDDVYDRNYGDSLGTSTVLTSGGRTDLASATFTYTGTGFDIIGRTSEDSAMIRVRAYKVTDGVAADKPSVTKLVDVYYQHGILNQIPVVHADTEYGTYKVVVEVLPASGVNGASESRKVFYFDGVRVYNPLAANAAEVDEYNADEKNVTIREIRKEVLNSKIALVKPQETGTGTRYAASVSNAGYTITENFGMDESGNKYTVHATSAPTGSSETSLEGYINNGPNNELYLGKGYGFAFWIDKTAVSGESYLQIEAKTLSNASVVVKEIYSGQEFTVDSSVAQYYRIDLSKCETTDKFYKVVLYVKEDGSSTSDIPTVSFTNAKLSNGAELAGVSYSTGEDTTVDMDSAAVAQENKYSSFMVDAGGERYIRKLDFSVDIF